MESRRRTRKGLGSESMNCLYQRDLSNLFYNEKLGEYDYYKKSSKNSSKHAEFFLDSDDDFGTELENAVEQYKKNKKNNSPIGRDSNLSRDQIKCESKQIQNINSLDNKDYEFKKEKISENAFSDIQELINYFFLKKDDKNIEKSPFKSYIDYEKQGAIPKSRRREHGGKNTKIKKADVDTESEKINKHRLGIEENQSKYNFIKNSNSEDVIVKISEESCSKPFFYIVPENPSPNFFLSRGSYYVIPKAPPSESKNEIFFHPENITDFNLSGSAFNSKIKFDGIIRDNSYKAEHGSPTGTNNLSKEVDQNMDSHLNIGPVDVKLNDSNNNLQSNNELSKIFSKFLLNLINSSSTCQTEEPNDGKELSKKNIEIGESSGGELMSDAERSTLQELDKTLIILLTEFPDLDANSAKLIANEYLFDENGLKNYIASAHLKRKIEQQLERMILALPEKTFEELRDVCNELKGEEELVDNYIQEIQKKNKIHEQILDIQFVLPDADPGFLRQEIEKLNGDTNAINILTNRLLEDKDYPKILEDPLNAVRRRWWRTLVEKFSVESYLLKVPNPGDFAGEAGDHNEANIDLILKFLESRYPTKNRDFFINAFRTNNENLTKTCNFVTQVEVVRLSESGFQNEPFSEAFLEEITYIDHRKEIDEYLKEIKERKEMEKEEARLNNSFLVCPLCSDDELIASEAFCCLEGHVFCKVCIKRYIFIKMGEGVFKFACPSELCDTFFSHTALQEVLPENILSNIINKQQADEICSAKVDGLESCPHCDYAYIPNPEDKIFKCQNPSCLNETCRKCGENNHIPLRCEEIERPKDLEARKKIEESMTKELIRICPKCLKKFVKIDGCNKMVCVCGTMMCYICRNQVSGYDHFSRSTRDGKCPLYSNNEVLHTTEVIQAGVRARTEILQENQDIRILHDPTSSTNYY